MQSFEINPIVRYIQKVSWKIYYKTFVSAYDYRLIYVSEGCINLDFKKNSVSLLRGDVIVIPPATPYRLESETEKFSYYIINFDFTDENTNYSSKTPDEEKMFREEEVFSFRALTPFENTVNLSECGVIEPFLQEMLYIKDSDTEEARMMKSGALKYIIGKLKLLSKTGGITTEAKELVKKVKTLVAEEWNKGINNQEAASMLGYHPYYLNSVFMKTEGQTLHKFIEETRIKKASEILVMSEKPIGEVAEECGFPDSSSFSAFFKKKKGVSPKEFKKNYQSLSR